MSAPMMSREDLVVMMNIMDADGSGDVERHEFEEYYRRAYQMTDAEFEKLWKKIDKNGDGCLQFDELCAYFGVDVQAAEADRQQMLEMSDEGILEALQLHSILMEEKQKREAEEKKKLKHRRNNFPLGGVREGVKSLKLTDVGPEAELLQECELGGLRKVDQLLEEGTNVRIQDEKAEMVLHKLAKVGAKEQLERVIKQMQATDPDAIESDINAPDKQGYTPLFHAVVSIANTEAKARKANDEAGASSVNTGIFTTLLKAGADLGHESNLGWNVLHLAAHHDSRAAADSILQFFKSSSQKSAKALHAFVNHADADGRVPLHIASFRANKSLVELLLTNSADPKIEDKNANTPMKLADRAGRRQSRETMEEWGRKQEQLDASYKRRTSKELPLLAAA